MFIMPYEKVKLIANLAPVEDQARATSEEYVISDLPRENFDILGLAELRK